MRPTRASVLALAVVVGGLLGLLAAVVGRRGDLPVLPATVPLTFVVLGVGEWVAARTVSARIDGRDGARPLAPTSVPSIAALARASSLTASLTVGAWAVLLVDRLLQADRVDAAGRDAVVAGLGLVASVVLVVGALRLEGVCRSREE